ncbi:hypothetical protein [Acaryochloris sp. IP29b_bin.148]|uniref:adenylate/guanylate cyclase domain-containing protein n=1 Tax=Acaryochloris sp. IP29b_bin.148 TaxID=2969218 RepID=UPI00262A4CAE|nr:hypothetical protein [Acaryochloris sp. IP29b_bin.148]
MLNLPQPIVTFLCSTVVRDRFPAYLQISKDGALLAFGGDCDRYGLNPLTLHNLVDEQIFFLAGLLPLEESALHIPFLQIEEDIIAEVHLFAEQEQDWVLLFDATTENAKHVLIQQKVNDLSLLRRKQAKSLSQWMDAETVAENILDIRPAGEQKLLTILVIKCCSISGLETPTPTTNPLRELDAYLSTISPLILDEGGLIHQSIGNSIVAVFGALPSTQDASQQAIAASIRILDTFQDQSSHQHAATQCALVVTTGTVTVGLLQVGFGKTLTVMGQPMDIAVNLNEISQAGTLIIDKQTFDRLDQRQRCFVPTSLAENTMVDLPSLYSYQKS